ncbi:MAG: hypothetical protein QJR07_17345 [Acetobacteraceae bacterium]|nr:hypothetical protein [Acetobacteraceae bacterium]
MQGIGHQQAQPAAPAFNIVFNLAEAEERQPAPPVHVAQPPMGSVVDAAPDDAQEIEAGEDANGTGRADDGGLPVPGFSFVIAS